MKTFVVVINWRSRVYILQAKDMDDAVKIVIKKLQWGELEHFLVAESTEDIIITADNTGAGMAFSYTNKEPVEDDDY